MPFPGTFAPALFGGAGVPAVPFVNNTKSVLFDGVDEAYTAAHSASLDITNNLSVGMWVKGGGVGTDAVVGKSQATVNYGWYFRKNGAKFDVLISADGAFTAPAAKRYTSSIDVFDDSWHHIAFTFASNVLKLYVDGVEDTSATKPTDGTVNTIFSNPAADLVIGANNNGGSEFYDGNIDEVWVNNVVITPAEMTTIYNAGDSDFDIMAGPQSGTVRAYYRMGDDPLDTELLLVDQSGNGNDMTGSNLEFADIVLDVAPTFNSKSFNYDGVDEYHRIAYDASMFIGAEMSWVGWVKSPNSLNDVVAAQWNTAAVARMWLIRCTTGGKMNVFLSQNGGSGSVKNYSSSVTVFDSTWHHIAITYNTNTLKLYIDGVEDTSVTKSSDFAMTVLYPGGADYLLGAIETTSPLNFGTGNFDEFGMYNKELTAANITTIYNSGSSQFNLLTGPENTSLVAYHRMGDDPLDSATVLVDQTSNGNDGVGTNFELADIESDVA